MWITLMKLGLKAVDKGLEESLKFLDSMGQVIEGGQKPERSNYWDVVGATYLDEDGKTRNLDRALSETYSEYWREFKAELED